MAFTSLDSNLLDVGDPIKKEIFDTIKTNEDDLDSRLTIQENGAGKIFVFNARVANGLKASSLTGIDLFKSQFAFTLIEAKIQAFEKGVLTGILEVDVQKGINPDAASFSSVFTTKPSLDYATITNYDESTNAVFDNSKVNIASGDYLRLDVSSLPTNGIINNFYISIIGELS